MSTTTIDEIVFHANEIKEGRGKVHPGQPVRFPEAASPGQGGWQGDLGLFFCAEPPVTYDIALGDKRQRQLVPGESEGARHCLDSLEGVDLWLPAKWGPDYDQLEGPYFRADREVTVKHPTHGDVTIPKGMGIVCRYQREFDAEQAKERRNAD